MNCRKWEIQILRQQHDELDPESEAALVKHLETCSHCRSTADKFSELDRLLLESREPTVPPFLRERIVSRVVEQMREDSLKSPLRNFISFFAHRRPILAGFILAAGIGIGVLTGLDLSRSMHLGSSAYSYDVLAFSGIEGGERDSYLYFIWTDTNGGGR